MENMSDLYQNSYFRALKLIYIDDCREACKCSRYDAAFILERVWRGAAGEINRRSHRIEKAGVAIAALGIPASVAAGNLLGDARITVGGMVLSSLIGTGVCMASKFVDSDNSKRVAKLAEKKLRQDILAQPTGPS